MNEGRNREINTEENTSGCNNDNVIKRIKKKTQRCCTNFVCLSFQKFQFPRVNGSSTLTLNTLEWIDIGVIPCCLERSYVQSSFSTTGSVLETFFQQTEDSFDVLWKSWDEDGSNGLPVVFTESAHLTLLSFLSRSLLQ